MNAGSAAPWPQIRRPLPDIKAMVAFVEAMLRSLPPKKELVDLYHSAAVERVRMECVRRGAIIDTSSPARFELGGVAGVAPEGQWHTLDEAMRDWLDKVAAAAVDGAYVVQMGGDK